MTSTSLPANDLRAVLDYATMTLRVQTYTQMRPLLAALARLVGSDTATLTHLNLRTQHEVAVIWPPTHPDPEVLPAYATLGHTHPLRRPLIQIGRTRPASVTPIRVSDVLTQRDWTATRIYREVLSGTSDQMVLPMSFNGPALRAVTLSRGAGGFTDRQRGILAACAEHLRNAVARAHHSGHTGLQLAPHPGRAPLATAPGPANPTQALSGREREVLEQVALGLTDAQIARKLGVRPATISKHLHRIYTRLRLRNRAEAARLWAAH